MRLTSVLHGREYLTVKRAPSLETRGACLRLALDVSDRIAMIDETTPPPARDTVGEITL